MALAVAYLLGGTHPIPLLPGTEFTFGRARTSSVHLKDAMVSREHAVLTCDPAGAIYLVDLGSSNKSFVNDEPIAPHKKIELKHDDKVRFGGSEFFLVLRSEKDDAGTNGLDGSGAVLVTHAPDAAHAGVAGQRVEKVPSRGSVSHRDLRATAVMLPPIQTPPEAVPALAGQLKVQSLPQVMQFLHHGSNTGELFIKNAQREGVLLFDKGVIFSAQAQELEGVEAIYALALLREGSFQFTDTEERPAGDVNVNEPMMAIVFECCRRFDEASRQ